jgi:hypothetical protein
MPHTIQSKNLLSEEATSITGGIMNFKLTILAACLSTILVGCGGGGDSVSSTTSATLTGTAASGAPIVGTVTIKDSSSTPKTKTVTIAADGKYTVDVSDMTAPFMMRADGTVGGRSYSLYSAAASSDINGTVNITPLTDLIVANIAGQVASSIYTSGNFSSLTSTALSQAETNLQQRLQPVLTALGLDTAIDLLRATFNANHTGLDAALDVLRVTVDPATAQATITNIINNQQIIDNLASQTDVTTVDATGVATGATDLQQIVAQFNAWSALFATSLPLSTNPALLALFDSTFKFDGEDLSTLLTDLTTDSLLIGAKFTNITLDTLTATEADVSFSVLYSGQSEHLKFKMTKVGGIWKIVGNQRIAYANTLTFARKDHTGVIDTGLALEIKDEGAVGIDYAIVTGSGLPTTTGGVNGASAGALLVNYISNNSFRLAQPGSPYNGASTALITNGHNQLALSDTAIGSFGENQAYTVTLWDDNLTPSNLTDDVLKATYTNVIGKRPYLLTELSAASFPTITTTATQIGSFAAAGGNLTVNWTLPSGLMSESVHFFRSGASAQDSTDADVTATATSALLTITAPAFTVMGSGINLYAEDVFGRELVTIINGQ